MVREYHRYNPRYAKDGKYIRKTIDKRGREIVKPFLKKDFEEMVRLCLIYRDKSKEKNYKEYYRWYRNYILLIVGVNTGSRITTIIEQVPRDYAGGKFTVTERKTGKRQQYTLNKDVYEIVKAYIEEFNIGLNEFMFRPSIKSTEAITRQGADKIIKSLAKDAKVEYCVATHSLRKSYGRWYWDETKDLLRTQELLQHNSPMETLRYICIEAHDTEAIRQAISNVPKYL